MVTLEKKNGNKYLILVSTDKNKEIKNLINDKPSEYEKDFMKMKFNSDDNLPLSKTLRLLNLTIIIRSVFQDVGKYYPQVFLDEYLYELCKCYNMKELMFQKELTLMNQISQKNV